MWRWGVGKDGKYPGFGFCVNRVPLAGLCRKDFLGGGGGVLRGRVFVWRYFQRVGAGWIFGGAGGWA